MSDVAEMPAPLLFTDSAADKVNELILEEGNPDLKLRVFVQGGGCSGFQYGFTFDEDVAEDDTVMQKNGVTLLIDAMSYQYLVGAEIDYKDDLQGSQFVIKNPNATTTCGCGSSFSA
ncbi:MAG: iron-sulfur cluster insertion protein ErpA [Lautropia sp.]|nr:iron-sulfur cluster insertion protein ErpA [Lautropia sp.]